MAEQAQAVTPVSEVLARPVPALSATSDAPVIEMSAADQKATEDAATAKAAEDKAAADKAAATDEGDEAAKKAAADQAAADVEAGKVKWEDLPSWAKADITKNKNARRAAEAAAKAAEAKADANTELLKKALDAVEKLTGESAARAAKSADDKDPRPSREAFDAPEAYDSALIEWAGRRAALAATASVEAKAEADKKSAEDAKARADTEAQNKQMVDAFAKRRETFEADHPDYSDVAEAEDVQISVPMAHCIMQDEDGPAIAYYLGQNKDEAERISKLPLLRAVSELGRIAAKLNAKPPVITRAKPIKPIGANASPAESSSTKELSMEEYAAKRTQELRAKSNGASPPH